MMLSYPPAQARGPITSCAFFERVRGTHARTTLKIRKCSPCIKLARNLQHFTKTMWAVLSCTISVLDELFNLSSALPCCKALQASLKLLRCYSSTAYTVHHPSLDVVKRLITLRWLLDNCCQPPACTSLCQNKLVGLHKLSTVQNNPAQLVSSIEIMESKHEAACFVPSCSYRTASGLSRS